VPIEVDTGALVVKTDKLKMDVQILVAVSENFCNRSSFSGDELRHIVLEMVLNEGGCPA
jgi:hypothetical protein